MKQHYSYFVALFLFYNSFVISNVNSKKTPPSLTHKKTTTQRLLIEASIGELVDKITILEIKLKKIKEYKKLENIKKELNALYKVFFTQIQQSPQLDSLKRQLSAVNTELWDIENEKRRHEAIKEFDTEFIDLARSVYFFNEKRALIKKEIDLLLNSHITEEKSYTSY